MHKEKILGNIYQIPIAKIWENLEHVKLKKELNIGLFPKFCNNFCDHVEFNAFIDWIKKQLNQNRQAKFRRIPRSWAKEFMNDKYKSAF
jgi:hypothetical protein